MSEEEEEIEVRISVNPDPPSASMPMLVCYDFRGLLANDVTVSLDFSGSWTGLSIKPTKEAPCVSVAIPEGSSTVLLEDMSGRSGDVSRVIGP
jgi:hypothetical protein